MACKSGIQRIYETSPIDTICQFYSILQVNYHIMSTKSEGWGVICRVKIDPLDLGKPHTKYIWGDSPLQLKFNEPICAVKTLIFNISHVETWNVPVTKSSKWPYESWPISRKRLKQTKRHLQGFKYGSSWVQINKQIENRFTLRGDIPT